MPDRGIVLAGSIDMFVQAVVEQVDAVTASPVRRADPNRSTGIDTGILAPGHVVIPWQAEYVGKLDVPACVRVPIEGGGLAVRRQEIIIVQRVKLCGQSTLLVFC